MGALIAGCGRQLRLARLAYLLISADLKSRVGGGTVERWSGGRVKHAVARRMQTLQTRGRKARFLARHENMRKALSFTEYVELKKSEALGHRGSSLGVEILGENGEWGWQWW